MGSKASKEQEAQAQAEEEGLAYPPKKYLVPSRQKAFEEKWWDEHPEALAAATELQQQVEAVEQQEQQEQEQQEDEPPEGFVEEEWEAPEEAADNDVLFWPTSWYFENWSRTIKLKNWRNRNSWCGPRNGSCSRRRRNICALGAKPCRTNPTPITRIIWTN